MDVRTASVKSFRRINLGAEGKNRSIDLILYYHNVMPPWLFVHRIPLYHGGIFFVARYKVKSVNWEMKDAH